MRGTFRYVLKVKSQYCFIDGEDGNTYFCHKNCLVNKNDWKYVWNGNSCEFNINHVVDKDTDEAVSVVPEKIINPRIEIVKREEEEAEKRKIERRARHEELMRKQNKRSLRNSEWSANCDDHRYYVIMSKVRGVESNYSIATSNGKKFAYFDIDIAKTALKNCKELNDGNLYLMRRCYLVRVGSLTVVRELTSKNKLGKELYRGIDVYFVD